MKKLNGKLYFESKDVICIIDLLLGTLGDKNFVSIQTSADRIIIEKAIKNYKQEILFTLKTENAMKFDFVVL